MRIRAIALAVVSLTIAVGVLEWTSHASRKVLAEVNPPKVETTAEERHDEEMRKVGLCRWWMLIRNLPDRAYERPDQIPDEKFRSDFARICPESRPDFVGPQDAHYFADRKLWQKEYGQYPEWKN